MKKIFKVLWIIALVVVIGFNFTTCDDDSGGGNGNGSGGEPTEWTAVADSTFGTRSNIRAIAYANGKFVAGGLNGTIAIATLKDGETWTAVDTGTIFDYVNSNGTTRKGIINAITFGKACLTPVLRTTTLRPLRFCERSLRRIC